ncbi:MAG: His/Gly/Thr/Pro-type tRNA ligase C-terminal domain-containing protein, partial [Chloroflexota bacterium]
WLAPVQARIIPIADRHLPYAQELLAKCKAAGMRVELDDSGERMNAKIRNAQLQKIPYMLVIGDREMEAGAAAVRLRTEKDLGAMPVGEFIARVQRLVAERNNTEL